MEPKDERINAERSEFVVAIMGKDYSKAIDLGTAILVRYPNDHLVRNCLVALEKLCKSKKIKLPELQEASSIDNETEKPEESTSGTEVSDEAASSSSVGSDEKSPERLIDLEGLLAEHFD